jgi:hypothetical protein
LQRLRIVRPVAFTAALTCLHKGRLLLGINRQAVSLQVALSDLTGFANPAGELVALAGFCPLDDGEIEFWFDLGPGARPHVRALIRIARLTLPAVAHHAPVHAHVRAGYEPGRRLAKLAGFHFAGAVHGFERWEFPNGRDRENVLGQGGAPVGAGLGRRGGDAQG